MRRRDFIVAFGGMAALWPAAGTAQHTARIGYLGVPPRKSEAVDAFFDELARLGYAEGRNLRVLFLHIGEEPPGRVAESARELVHAGVDVVVAEGSDAPLRATRALTDSIPIVIVAVNYDPIERGYAASLAHPGGNATGIFFRGLELVGKQVELLKEIAPQATRLSVVWGTANQDEFAAAERSARTQGFSVDSFQLGNPPYDLDAVFRRIAEKAPQIALVLSPPGFAGHHRAVAALSLRYRVPAMFRFKDFVEAGGLISYGVNDAAMRRIAAAYVAKILRGARPADLPIERADRFELAINVKTAEALGIKVPPLLLARADEVID